MARDQPYDGAAKWLLEHCGADLAVLAGLADAVSVKALQPEVVQRRRIPDGLLEVRRRGRRQPTLLLIEFCTYPESRNPQQLAEDLMLVLQARGALPEALALVLCPKGQQTVPETHAVVSEQGTTQASFRWVTRHLWQEDGDALLARGGSAGLAPWAVLMKHAGPPEPYLRRCRERIDRAGGPRKEDLLAVSQAFVQLRFENPALMDLFQGSQTMLELPIISEFGREREREARRKDIAAVLLARGFAPPDDDERARLAGLKDDEALETLLAFAVTCPDRAAFTARLTDLTTPKPPPTSTRRRRKA